LIEQAGTVVAVCEMALHPRVKRSR
jgi:hypothetical protein